MKPNIKTIQEWVEWAEEIDNNSDTDGSQWKKCLVSCDTEIEFLEGRVNMIEIFIKNVKETETKIFLGKVIEPLRERIKQLEGEKQLNEGK